MRPASRARSAGSAGSLDCLDRAQDGVVVRRVGAGPRDEGEGMGGLCVTSATEAARRSGLEQERLPRRRPRMLIVLATLAVCMGPLGFGKPAAATTITDVRDAFLSFVTFSGGTVSCKL